MAAIMWAVVQFLFQQVLLKFVVYTVLFLFVTEAVQWLTQYLSSSQDGGVNSVFSAINSIGTISVGGQVIDPVGSFWYLFGLMRLGEGIGLIMTAYATRFLIRRIPVIG